MAYRSVCPPDQELAYLLFGQAPQSEVEELESHFAQCERCLRTARGLQVRDTLVGMYSLACAYALAIGAARSDAGLAMEEQDQLAERYAAKAVAILEKVAAQGYFKDSANAKSLATDKDLQSVRDRSDFARWLQAAVTGNIK